MWVVLCGRDGAQPEAAGSHDHQRAYDEAPDERPIVRGAKDKGATPLTLRS